MSLRNFALPSVLTFVILMSCSPAALGQEKGATWAAAEAPRRRVSAS